MIINHWPIENRRQEIFYTQYVCVCVYYDHTYTAQHSVFVCSVVLVATIHKRPTTLHSQLVHPSLLLLLIYCKHHDIINLIFAASLLFTEKEMKNAH